MIEVRNLTKSFGVKLAVNGVSFNVERGEVLGFLGPNGAGKSTTMRMITGFIPPSEGDVVIGGFKMVENPIAAKRLIGYLPENAPSYTDMTVLGFLGFAAELRGLRGAEKERAVDRVVEMCFLDSVLHQSIETLVQRIPASHLFCAVDHSRSRGVDPGRADRWTRSQPETRSADFDPEDGREKGDHFFDPYSGGGRSGLFARDHHRSRPDRG